MIHQKNIKIVTLNTKKRGQLTKEGSYNVDYILKGIPQRMLCNSPIFKKKGAWKDLIHLEERIGDLKKTSSTLEILLKKNNKKKH